jgi:hypothetical protein
VPTLWDLRSALRVFVVLAIAGCGAGWRRSEPMPAGPLPPRQQVQVWASGQVLRLHGVIVGADSVSGVPFSKPLHCERCRVGLRRGQVDSLRTGDPMNSFWGTTALGVVVTLVVLCRLGRCEAGGT